MDTWLFDLIAGVIGSALWLIVYGFTLGDANKASKDSKEFLKSIKNKEDS